MTTRTLSDYSDLGDLPDERLGMLANRARQLAPSSRFTLDADDAHRIFTELIRRRADSQAIAGTAIARPGDKLIVCAKPPFTVEQADNFRKDAAMILPGVEVVVIQAEQLLVYRPNEDPA